MYNKRVFRIIPANEADREAIRYILTEKTWWPESTSTPPLPATFDPQANPNFDYRELLHFFADLGDGTYLVLTRKQYDLGDFGVNVIPTADWTNRYNCSVAPTIEEYNYTSLVNGGNTRTNIDAFRSYDYNLFTNDI